MVHLQLAADACCWTRTAQHTSKTISLQDLVPQTQLDLALIVRFLWAALGAPGDRSGLQHFCGRPRGLKTVPTHIACNSDVSGDDDYFRDVLAFEEGAKNHPQVQALHDGPIKNKFLHTFGTVKKNLKNVAWYPVVTPAGLSDHLRSS